MRPDTDDSVPDSAVARYIDDAATLAFTYMKANEGELIHVSEILAFVRRYMPGMDLDRMEMILDHMAGSFDTESDPPPAVP
jgi:hypothetical protein